MDEGDDLLERAKVVSEATGRSLADVLADLADDGILNNSHKSDGGDLISQLQEAAELINTVQNINQKVSENTVLNGGNNATEVKVDTTLEGDIVDRAIASAQRKADALKKLALVFAPVFLLLGGGGAYGMMNDDPTTPADTYDEWDDWSNDCWPDWWWTSSSASVIENSRVWVDVVFEDMAMCAYQMNGDLKLELLKNNQPYDEVRWDNQQFYDHWEAQHEFMDLGEGQYRVEVRFEDYTGSHWTYEIMQFEIGGCGEPDLELADRWAEVMESDNDSLTLHMSIRNLDPECPQEVELMVSAYHNNTYQWTWEYGDIGTFWVNDYEEITMQSSALENLEKGTWTYEMRYRPMGGDEDCCYMTDEITIE